MDIRDHSCSSRVRASHAGELRKRGSELPLAASARYECCVSVLCALGDAGRNTTCNKSSSDTQRTNQKRMFSSNFVRHVIQNEIFLGTKFSMVSIKLESLAVGHVKKR